jgi:hypothetical protein
MSNPFKTVLDAVVAELRTSVTVLKYVEEYNGQAMEEVKRIVRDRGTSAFVQLAGISATASGPESDECAMVHVAVAVAAPGTTRDTSAAAAWAALWLAYEALRQGTSGIAWLAEDWHLGGMHLESQETDLTVVVLELEAHAEMADAE